MADLQEIWTVDECTNFVTDGKPIMVVSSKEEAIRRAKALNNKEAYGVILEEDNTVADCDYNNYILRSCEYKYYDVGSFYVDDKFYLDKE